MIPRPVAARLAAMIGRLSERGRMGTPEEVADLVVFLASDASRSSTGAAINIHGDVLIS